MISRFQLFFLTFLSMDFALVLNQTYSNALNSKSLPRKPSPANGAQHPQQNIPFSATANGEMVSDFSGVSFKVLELAADILNKSLFLTAKGANVSMDRVISPWAAISGIRFNTWFPLGGANLPVPNKEFFLWPPVEIIARKIGLAVVESFDPLCADDEDAYLSNADYVANLHHGFNNDPLMIKNMDLGLWLKFVNPLVLTSRFLFPINNWTREMEESLRVVYRYIMMDDWHYIDFYGRNCLSGGQRDDGARVKH